MDRSVAAPFRIEDAYEEHRRYVLTVLSRRCGWMEPDEREEVFQEACLVLLERERDGRLDLRAMAPAQVRAFLTQTAINKALDEGKRAGRSRSVPLEDAELAVADEARAPEAVAAAGLEGARVREIVGDLSERKAAIVKLRFYFERSPDEIQQFLGISERVYRRELERALREIQDGFSLVREGTYCDSRRSGILALIAGISGPGRAQATREHLATCPSCSAWAAQMRDAARKVGAVLPMPDLLLRRGPLERLLGAIEGLRDGAAEAGASAKHQATALAARVDQSAAGMLGGARPGAAALVVGCLALGGGATYCAVNGVPDPFAGGAGPASAKDAPDQKRPAVVAPSPVTPGAVRQPAAVAAADSSRSSATKAQKRAKKKRDGARASRSEQVQGAKPAPVAEPVEQSLPEEFEAAPEEEFSFEGETEAPPTATPSSAGPSGSEFGP